MTLSEQHTACMARIRGANHQPVGAGFLAAPGLVITCAHVVADALGLSEEIKTPPSAEIQMDFPFAEKKRVYNARVLCWNWDEDIAGLEFDQDHTDRINPPRLILGLGIQSHHFETFGYPKGRSAGVWSTGVFRQQNTRGWIQMESDTIAGYSVKPGFSGASVWDTDLESVVGIVAIADTDSNVRAAFAIPLQLALKACPELSQYVKIASLPITTKIIDRNKPYRWLPFPTAPQIPEHQPLSSWLDKHMLSRSPFGPGSLRLDELLLRSWLPPQGWATITSERPTLIWSPDDEDRTAVALMLEYHVQTVFKHVFPATIVLPPLANFSNPTDSAITYVTRAIGDAWTRFVAFNPEVYLNLPKNHAALLASLLNWANWGFEGLRLALIEDELDPDTDLGGAVVESLYHTLHSVSPQVLTNARLEAWLRLRPPDLSHTFLILNCQDQQNSTVPQEQFKDIIALSTELAAAGIVLKALAPFSLPKIPPIMDPVTLTWSDANLDQMLKKRMFLASQALEHIGELFGPVPDPDANLILVEKAQGSLSRMLYLGRKLLMKHITSMPSGEPDFYLDIEMLKSIA